MKSKKLWLMLASAWLTMTIAVSAYADVRNELKVIGVRVANDGLMHVYTSPRVCTDPKMKRSNPKYKRVFEAAMAAYVSGAPVALAFDASSCEIDAIRLGDKYESPPAPPPPRPTQPTNPRPPTPPVQPTPPPVRCPPGQTPCPGDGRCVTSAMSC